MSGKESHIYVVGDFFAKYYGKRVIKGQQGDKAEYALVTYAHRVTQAEFVWDAEVPVVDGVNVMCPQVLEGVEIFFKVDPAGYGKPFLEDLRAAVIADVKLEGVVKEHKRSFGTIRGRLYARVHVVAGGQ